MFEVQYVLTLTHLHLSSSRTIGNAFVLESSQSCNISLMDFPFLIYDTHISLKFLMSPLRNSFTVKRFLFLKYNLNFLRHLLYCYQSCFQFHDLSPDFVLLKAINSAQCQKIENIVHKLNNMSLLSAYVIIFSINFLFYEGLPSRLFNRCQIDRQRRKKSKLDLVDEP